MWPQTGCSPSVPPCLLCWQYLQSAFFFGGGEFYKGSFLAINYFIWPTCSSLYIVLIWSEDSQIFCSTLCSLCGHQRRNVPVLCCVWPSRGSLAVQVFIKDNTRKEWYPAAGNCVFRRKNTALLSFPCHALQETLPAQRSCLYVHLILSWACKMILNTDFALCYFPLSKHCLSPPSSNKIILEA